LKAQKCDEIQGYYFCRPVHAEEIAYLLNHKQMNHQSSRLKQEKKAVKRKECFEVNLARPLTAGVITTLFNGRYLAF
jgi:hypothetical protein